MPPVRQILRRAACLLPPAFFCFLLAPQVEASTLLTSSTSASASLFVCVSNGGCGGYTQNSSDPLSSYASASGSASGPSGPYGDVSGHASASVSSLKYGFISVNVPYAIVNTGCSYIPPGANCYFSGSVQSSATASFDDQITIFGSTGTGTLYYFDHNVFNGTGSVTSNLPTTFTYGVPFDISATVTATSFQNTNPDSMGGTGGFAFFSLGGGVYVFPADGLTRITNYTYTSASGARYAGFDDYGGVFVSSPEPATLSLVVLAAAAMLAFRSRSRRT